MHTENFVDDGHLLVSLLWIGTPFPFELTSNWTTC